MGVLAEIVDKVKAIREQQRLDEIKRRPQISDESLLRENSRDSLRRRRGKKYRSILGEQPTTAVPIAATQTLLGV